MKFLRNLLHDRPTLFQVVHDPKQSDKLFLYAVVVSVIFIFVYGIVAGTFSPSWLDWLKTGKKMLVVLFGGIAIATPSLYVFSAFQGTKLKVRELVFFLALSLTAASVVLISLLPIVWLFTFTATHEGIPMILNVAAVTIALILLMVVLNQGVSFKAKSEAGTRALLVLWFIVVGVVLARIADLLGPWFVK